MVTEITKEFMETGVESSDEILRIVMFYGDTCGPCKRTMPEYEFVADHFTKKEAPILFFRINAWNPEEQKSYCQNVWAINGVPEFKAFILGNVIHSKTGSGDSNALFKFIQECVDESFKKCGVRI